MSIQLISHNYLEKRKISCPLCIIYSPRYTQYIKSNYVQNDKILTIDERQISEPKKQSHFNYFPNESVTLYQRTL